jgi:DNA-binding PadR family transcriptional regulator
VRPLSEPEFQILLALADADRHGYAIIKEVEERTDGEVRLGAGTLYGAIRRFVDSGFIVERELDAGDERRRVYALTKAGRRAAADEAARLQRLVAAARSKKLLRG